jgi:hypothetical protein
MFICSADGTRIGFEDLGPHRRPSARHTDPRRRSNPALTANSSGAPGSGESPATERLTTVHGPWSTPCSDCRLDTTAVADARADAVAELAGNALPGQPADLFGTPPTPAFPLAVPPTQSHTPDRPSEATRELSARTFTQAKP